MSWEGIAMNQYLLSSYLNISLVEQYRDSVSELSKYRSHEIYNALVTSKIPWSYEVLSESVVNDIGPASYQLSVAVYLPGNVRVGYGSCKLTKREADLYAKTNALNEAISNALSTFVIATIDKSDDIQPLKEYVKPEITPMPEPIPEVPVTVQQKAKPDHGFSDNQVARINRFKEKFSINGDDDFVRLLTIWNPEATSKTFLTPHNVDSFLDYMHID